MLRKTSLVLLIFSCVFISCSKEEEQDGVQVKRDRHENFCSTQRDPNLISLGRVSHDYITDKDIIRDVNRAMKSMVKHKRYIKVELRPEQGEYTIKMYDFENEEARQEKQAYLESKEDHKAKINTNTIRTIHSTPDGYYANVLFETLMGQIWDFPHLFSPCEQDLIIFQFNGIWYVEDCC